MDRLIETVLLAARWLLLPLYLGLLAAVVAIYAMVGRELLQLAHTAGTGTDFELVLLLLSLLDLVLVANLMVMVAVSWYESYIARIDVAAGAARPEWLGKLDSGNVKLKVALSVVMITAIHLLHDLMMEATTERLLISAGVLLVFVVATLAFAVIDRLHQ